MTGQDGDIGNLQNIVDGYQTMTVYKNVADEAGVTLVLVDAILNGKTPGAELCEEFAADAASIPRPYSARATRIRWPPCASPRCPSAIWSSNTRTSP